MYFKILYVMNSITKYILFLFSIQKIKMYYIVYPFIYTHKYAITRIFNSANDKNISQMFSCVGIHIKNIIYFLINLLN